MRLPYFDNAKYILITLVVIGHLLDSTVVDSHDLANAAFVFIYSFHMPLFIFISGLFVHLDRLSADKTTHRVVFFILMGFLSKILLPIIPLASGSDYYFALLSDGSVPWFMFALAAYYALAYFLRNLNPTIILVSAIILGLVSGYDSTIGDYLYLSRIVVFFPFFWIGCILEAKTIASFMERRTVRIVALVIVVGFAFICITRTSDVYPYRYLFTGRNSFSVIMDGNCTSVNRFISYLISTAMCFGVLGIIPHASVPLLSEAGSRTLQVYLLHVSALQLLDITGIAGYVAALPSGGWVFLVPIAVLIALILSERHLGIPLKWIDTSLGRVKG